MLVAQVHSHQMGIDTSFRLCGDQRQLTGLRASRLCAVRGTGHGSPLRRGQFGTLRVKAFHEFAYFSV